MHWERPQGTLHATDCGNSWCAPRLDARAWRPADGCALPYEYGRSLSRDAVALLAAWHTRTAAHICPSLRSKVVSPHGLRHTSAMRLLQAGVDPSTINRFIGVQIALG